MEATEVRKHLMNAGGLMPGEDYTGPTTMTTFSLGRGIFYFSAPVVLSYFAIRGISELAVLMLEDAGFPYRCERLLGAGFRGIKHELPFGRLPLLRSGSLVLSQSNAIVRMLGCKLNLDGGTATADMMYEQLLDSNKEIDTETRDALLTSDKEVARCGSARSASSCANHELRAMSGVERAIAHLVLWEGLVAKGWVLSSSQGAEKPVFCYVDIALWQLTRELGAEWLHERGFGSLATHTTAVAARPNIAAYMQSAKLMPSMNGPAGGFKYVPDKYFTKFKFSEFRDAHESRA